MTSDQAGSGPAPRPPDAVPDATPPARPALAELGVHKITDPRAMRALAHPLRLALLEALMHAGTLTATQASELLGESPANCAFHLRTLAKYGYVVEAGGGKGRERPWRRTHVTLQITSDQEDPSAAIAAGELGQYWLDVILDRARSNLRRDHTWPPEWQHNLLLGENENILYVTPQEAAELGMELFRLFRRFEDREDHPERRPPGAMPIESLLLSYPLLHLASRPTQPAGDEAPGELPPGE